MSIKRTSDSSVVALTEAPIVALTEAELDTVAGGLLWEGHRESTNIEDRRAQTMGDFARWDKTSSIGGYGGGGGGPGKMCSWFKLC